VRVNVSIPTHGEWKSEFGISLATMAFDVAQDPPEGLKSVCWSCVQHSILPASRDLLVQQALDGDATHILWLDCDMAFPRDTLSRLIAHGKDIVGANCVRRVPPYAPTAVSLQNSDEFVWTEEGMDHLEEVSHTGLAVTLVNADVYRKLPRPWHSFTWNERKVEYTGEDVGFVRAARKAGFRCYVDHGLSQKVQHVGSAPFDFDWARGFRAGQQEARLTAETDSSNEGE
jgi:hypothetical protein